MDSPSHTERKHEIFSASSAFRWAGYPGERGCPSSALLAQKLPPEPPSEAAAEGTHAHEVLERLLKGEQPDQTLPDEMIRGVMAAVMYVERLKQTYPNLRIYSEIKIEYIPGVGGSFDILCHCPDTFQVWVIDFKYGKYPVSPCNNPQLLCYSIFARQEFAIKAWAWHLVIVQPRDFNLPAGQSPVKEWTCGPADLDAWEYQVKKAAAEAHQDVLRPEAKRCRHCRAAAICPALLARVNTELLPIELVKPKAPRKKPGQDKEPAPPPFVRFRGQPGQPEATCPPGALDPSVLGAVGAALDGLPEIEAYVKSTRELADELALVHNLEIPGSKVVYADPRVSWDAEPKTIVNELWRLARVSPGDSMPPELVAITTAKALLGAAIAEGKHQFEGGLTEEEIWAEFGKLTKRLPSGKKQLVPASDRRPAAALVDLDRELTADAECVSIVGAEEINGKLAQTG